MIAFRDDAHVRSQVRGPLAPDRWRGEWAAHEYLERHARRKRHAEAVVLALIAAIIFAAVLL